MVTSIKNSYLNKKVSDSTGVKIQDVKFIIDRYFHYGILAMLHGYGFNACNKIGFRLAYILYTDIPKRLRNMFTYSSKIFGITILPVCERWDFKKAGYNFKPNKKILSQIAEFTETDAIYTLLKR